MNCLVNKKKQKIRVLIMNNLKYYYWDFMMFGIRYLRAEFF